jgi:hypothetical protein
MRSELEQATCCLLSSCQNCLLHVHHIFQYHWRTLDYRHSLIPYFIREILERTNLPTFLTLFKNVICIKTSVFPNITLVGNSVPILKHSHIQNNVSNKRIVDSSWSFTILNFYCATANSCISGSRSFIIFFCFIHLRRKLNSLKRHDIAQNYRILHRVFQRLSQHNLKISHDCHI